MDFLPPHKDTLLRHHRTAMPLKGGIWSLWYNNIVILFIVRNLVFSQCHITHPQLDGSILYSGKWRTSWSIKLWNCEIEIFDLELHLCQDLWDAIECNQKYIKISFLQYLISCYWNLLINFQHLCSF